MGSFPGLIKTLVAFVLGSVSTGLQMFPKMAFNVEYYKTACACKIAFACYYVLT